MNPIVLDLSDPAYWVDPYPTLAAARSYGRTTRTSNGDLVLLHAADVDKTLMDNKNFRQPGLENLELLGIFDGPFYEWRRYTLAVMDGKNHLRLRSYVSSSFAPRQMLRLRALASERAHQLIDACAESGEMDVLEQFASDLPLWAMCRFIGIDEEDRLKIDKFLVGTEEGFSAPMTPEKRARVEASITALDEYVIDLIARRRIEPREDVVSLLVAEQDRHPEFSDQELAALIVNIIGGSVGSTRAAFANSVLEFVRHPDQAAMVRADPGLITRAVEECLRYHPPFRIGGRVSTTEQHMFGEDLVPGQRIFIARQSYNRDPERYDDPDRFDIMRTEKRHVSFGFGAHFCLGQAVARTNLEVGLQVFLDRCHNLQLVEEPRRLPFAVDEQLDAVRVRFDAQPRLGDRGEA